MSFTIKPNLVPTITPIEIGILIIEFLKKEYGISISLKWPNDLLTGDGKKCGGIITQYIDSETVIAGLGLNLGCMPELIAVPGHYKHGLGNVSDVLKLSTEDHKEIPAKIYNFILQNRIGDITEMQTQFLKSCFHIGREVLIDDDDFNYEGKFIGIGKNGEALIEIDGTIRSFLSSSLKIL
jgi:BirA family biotin operon repressor/biotin-[acetyl-CoA-carboxylase] ligase